MSGFSDPSRCHVLCGYMDVRCDRPKGHDGGHVGPFYIPKTPPSTPADMQPANESEDQG